MGSVVFWSPCITGLPVILSHGDCIASDPVISPHKSLVVVGNILFSFMRSHTSFDQSSQLCNNLGSLLTAGFLGLDTCRSRFDISDKKTKPQFFGNLYLMHV